MVAKKTRTAKKENTRSTKGRKVTLSRETVRDLDPKVKNVLGGGRRIISLVCEG